MQQSLEKRIRWYQRYTDASWRVDETSVKVAGEWTYFYPPSAPYSTASPRGASARRS